LKQSSNHNPVGSSVQGLRFRQSEKYRLLLVGESHPQRRAVECFIKSRFAAVHGARITCFMPLILALSDTDNDIRAAIGVRAAGEDDLFLEHYFETAIEHAIVDHGAGDGRVVEREQIVEVGNLASVDRFASRRLFEQLAFYLINNRFQWVVFTGCRSLRQLFKRMQLELVELGCAKESCLPSGYGSWGNYYDDNPRVLLGHLSSGLILAQRAVELMPRSRA